MSILAILIGVIILALILVNLRDILRYLKITMM